MKIGFTGTQKGLTIVQRSNLLKYLAECTELHNGFCIGADEECLMMFDLMANTLPTSRTIIGHPPIKTNKMSKFRPEFCRFEFRQAEEYLIRNHHIVDACEKLIAAPELMSESLRSGTWATVRYARFKKRPIVILWPDGSIKAEWHQASDYMTTP